MPTAVVGGDDTSLVKMGVSTVLVKTNSRFSSSRLVVDSMSTADNLSFPLFIVFTITDTFFEWGKTGAVYQLIVKQSTSLPVRGSVPGYTRKYPLMC